VLLGPFGVGPEALFATIMVAIVMMLDVVSVSLDRVRQTDPGKRWT